MGTASLVDAAGGVVYRLDVEARPQYLLVHRPRYDDWSLPKGKLEPGEAWEDGAQREVAEETGLPTQLELPIGAIAYETADGITKRVRYWLMRAGDGAFASNGEVDRAVWLSGPDAARRLSYVPDRAVLDRADTMLTRPDAGRIHLVRHAEAGNREAWTEPDHQRPLTDLGRAQTTLITRHLRALPLMRLLSSHMVRCRETLAPLATEIGVEVEESPGLAEGADLEATLGVLEGVRATTAALSSHGDIIETVVTHFAASGAAMPDRLEWEKGSLWVLDLESGAVVTARYVPPPL